MKNINILYTTTKIIALSGFLLTVTACGNTVDRLNNIGKEPALTKIENPKLDPGYRKISMPMPEERPYETAPNSLWNVANKSFFKDQRASQIGDILTIIIDIKDKAELDNKSERKRSSDESMDMPGMLGLESQITKVLPEGTTAGNLITTGSEANHSGEGTIDREEKVEMKVAATVIDKLPNGNLIIHGRQEMRVNYEVRQLEVSGIVRPEDIATTNTVSYEKIAEARMSYGGKGMISDVQQPRYGNQALDILLPF